VRGNWLVGGPEMLFEYAECLNQLSELNLAALDLAIANAAALPGEPLVFINLDPIAFRAPRLIPTIKAATARAGVDPARIVLEATERSGFADVAEVSVVFEELRALGLRFALDDHASAYSHLAVIDQIRPTFMKISSTFGTSFESHATRLRVVHHIVALAHDLGCETILEGIEHETTALAAATAGVDLMQGYYFGRPEPASHWV
jgi:EAL domain-containing protein (putative c-di-GMP-specific phosphodiesterase class I)